MLEELRDPNSPLVQQLSKLDDTHLTALNRFLENTNATKNDYKQAIREFLSMLPDKEIFKSLKLFMMSFIKGEKLSPKM